MDERLLMGRKTIEINLDLLKKTIEEVEAAGPLANLSALYKQVSDAMLTKGETAINPQLVRLRIEALRIPVKTLKGRKGRAPGQKVDLGSIPNRSGRQMRAEVRSALLAVGPSNQKGQISRLRYTKILNRASKGSLKARLTLKCLECANFQQEEVRNCGGVDCVLYDIRPFKTAKEKVEKNEC
jgi:hypothetical protein